MSASLEKFFFKPSTGEALSVLRIAIGLGMLLKGLFLFPHMMDLYGPYGYLQAPLMVAIGGENISSWSLEHGISTAAYSSALHVFFVVHLLAAFCFMIGFRTRVANIVLWTTQALFFQMAWVSAYGIDAYSQNISFLLMFLPVGRFFSVDAWLKPQDTSPSEWCTFGLRFIQIYVLMTYVDAGVSKGLGHDWWNGNAIWEVLHFPEFNRMNFFWMASYPIVPKLLGWGTLVLETFYIVGVWIPRLGRWWVLGIIGMHLTIAFLMGLTLFGLTLAMVNAALFLGVDRFPRHRNRRPRRRELQSTTKPLFENFNARLRRAPGTKPARSEGFFCDGFLSEYSTFKTISTVGFAPGRKYIAWMSLQFIFCLSRNLRSIWF